MKLLRALMAALTAIVIFNAQAQLTPGSPVNTGTAVNQTPSAQPAATNLSTASGDFTKPDWLKTTTTAVSLAATQAIEFGTLPATLTTSAGSASEISQFYTSMRNYAVAQWSAYFTVMQGGALITNASTNVQIGVRYSAGYTQTYSVNFNPANGQVIGSSGPGVAVAVQSIPVYDPIVPGKINVWYRVAVGAKNASTGTFPTATAYIKPSTTATVGAVIAYGGQFETVPPTATSYYTAASPIIATPSLFINNPSCGSVNCGQGALYVLARGVGQEPRQAITDTHDYLANTINTTYTGAMNGITLKNGGNTTLTLPSTSINNGESFSVNTTTGNTLTLQADATVCVYDPSTAGTAALANSYVIPANKIATVTYSNGNGTIPTACAGGAGAWVVSGVYGGGVSPVIPAPGGAGTIIRSDGTSWKVSQDTWPDLVASGNVLFATAANTVGSNNSFTWATNVLTSPTITATTQVLGPAGSAATPSFGFTGSNAGIYSVNNNDLRFVANGNAKAGIFANNALGLNLANDIPIGWPVGTTVGASNDTGISRVSAGVVGVGTGAQGSVAGTLSTTNIIAPMSSDATHTTNTVCQDTTSKQFYFGSGTLGVCLGTSSERFKHDIEPLDVGLNEIIKLKAVRYYLNEDHGDSSKPLYGFTAEQGGKVLPLLMGKDAEGQPNSFDYVGVIPVLVKAVQEQQKQIAALKAKVEKLEADQPQFVKFPLAAPPTYTVGIQ